jgi:rod shape-determining protein MreD
MRRKRPIGFITLTFIIAVFLTILPLPEWAQYARPFWIMLVLIYWVMVMPEYVCVGTAWFLGLLIDVIQGTVLGQHALAMMVVAYLTYKLQYQLRVFPVWQQAIAVFLFISFAQLLVLWSNALMGQSVASYWQQWIAVLFSAILWPWIYSVLHAYQIRYRVQL